MPTVHHTNAQLLPRGEQEVAVLGSQPLSVLLEALQCPLAQQVQAEHARAPSQCPCPAAAFLYIEGTFYVQQPAGAT